MFTAIFAAAAGVAAGYGFRGFIRRHLNSVTQELKTDLQIAHDRLVAVLPRITAEVEADVQKAIASLKKVL